LNCILIVITSDKCYENKEWEFAYRENDPLGGHDIYSMSKGRPSWWLKRGTSRFLFPTRSSAGGDRARGQCHRRGDYAQDRIVPIACAPLREKKPNPGPQSVSGPPLATRSGVPERLSLAGSAAEQGTENVTPGQRLQFWSGAFGAPARQPVG